MQPKNYRIISLILAIAVSLTGMYFENTKADARFVCNSAEETCFYVLSADDLIQTEQLCATEISGAKGIKSINQLSVRHNVQKRVLQLFSYYLYSDIVSLKIGMFFSGSEIALNHSRCMDELVANYIHNSDGKKRI